MKEPVVSNHEVGHGTVRSYSLGFGISLILTLISYGMVSRHLYAGSALLAFLALLAIIQLGVQLVFFLHVGRESRPRWNLVALLFALIIVVIIVFGSLWIMQNLNYNHKAGAPINEPDSHIIKDEGYSQ